MNILITGGAGFIGSHVTDRMLANGHHVTVLDNLMAQVHGADTRMPVNLAAQLQHPHLRFIHGDIRDRAALRNALDGVDTVIHLAAVVGVGQSMYTPHIYADVNVTGQALLHELMAEQPHRYRRFIVASSMSIYGEGSYRCEEHGSIEPGLRDEPQLKQGIWEVRCPSCGDVAQPTLTSESKRQDPGSIYAITKKTQEECALVFGRAYGIPTVALRFFNVFGSRQSLSNPYTGIAAIFTSRLRSGKPPLIFEDGQQTRDFIHVSDVADAVARSVECDLDGAIALNVCTGRALSVDAVARAIGNALQTSISSDVVGRYRAGDVRHCVGSPLLAEQVLGFRARTSFADGLRELMAWSTSQSLEDKVEASLFELEDRGLLR